MKCKSCEGEVPPKFAHAIAMNCCPLCGEVIMDEALQSSLLALKEAMKAVSNYPNEIFDWFRSNYNLYTQDSVNAIVVDAEEKVRESSRKLFEKPNIVAMQKAAAENPEESQVDKDGNQITGTSLQPASQTNIFFKNAQANKVLSNQDHFRKIANEIKKSGTYSGQDGGGALTPEMAEIMVGSGGDVDPAEMAELRAAFGDTSQDLNSGLDPADIDYEDEIPQVVLNMAGGSGVNQRDLLKLQNLQHKSAAAKNQIAKTGSVGLIRR